MTAAAGPLYAPELMDEQSLAALMSALRQVYEGPLIEKAWPAAFDARRAGDPVPLEEIEFVVLPLDRIGAPAGASGARVFIAYFSHRHSGAAAQCLLASPPLVVKIGSRNTLNEELTAVRAWPTLQASVSTYLAMPLGVYDHSPDTAVLVAPFQSQFAPANGGQRHGVQLKDLWGLLHDEKELTLSCSWSAASRHIGLALSTIDHVHRGGLAQYRREQLAYGKAYAWYLRGTHPSAAPPSRVHVPRMLFGNDDSVSAFGKQWVNPSKLIDMLVGAAPFEGTIGCAHGDLHPKNIVVGYGNVAHIIDFGWARPTPVHVVVDYALLDINVRAITLPSQISETHALAIGSFLDPSDDPAALPPVIKERAQLIKERIWAPLQQKQLVRDWRSEYLIPFFMIAYGLIVHLDAARNQDALIASILAAGQRIKDTAPP